MIAEESLKARIRNKSKNLNINSQQLLQMYFFERILLRISKSKYNGNFILKGGLLLSSLFGNENRTTKDMDATLKDIPINMENIKKILLEILAIDVGDNINFEFVSINEIMEQRIYGGFRIAIKGILTNIKIDLSIDISTGDNITPREIKYKYNSILTDESYTIMSYPIETILAEKFETIITRASANTRMKDFYDVYMIMKLFREKLDDGDIVKAIDNTFNNRNSKKFLSDMKMFIEEIESSQKIKKLWTNYHNDYPYSIGISFKDIINKIKIISEIYGKELVTN